MKSESPLFIITTTVFAVFSLAHGQPQRFADREDHWLAFDTRAFDTSTVKGLEMVHGAVEKHPANPPPPTDKPWEEATNNLYPNLEYDPDEKLFKLWYKDVLEDKSLITRMQPPRTTHDVGWYLLYATSRDGLKWEKPLLDQHGFTGAGPTNAVARDCPNAGVFRDTNPACPADRRYKMFFDRGPGITFVAFSADGIRWADPISVTIPGFKVGDTHNNAFWDARLKKYVLFTRHYLGERTIARAVSEDFLRWEESEMVLRPTVEEGASHQLYNMSVFRYGNAYVGLVMNYHLGAGRTVDCELAWSPDSREWHRLLPGRAFLPLGPKGSHDSKAIYAQANPPLVGADGRLMIYYGGDDFEHRGWVRSCLLSLATVRRDGFAGWRAQGTEKTAGTVTTHPLQVAGDVTLCADVAAGGSVRVSLLDADGQAIAGYGAAEVTPITATVTDGALRWGTDTTEALTGRIVRLKFEIAGDATLFSISGLTDPGRPMVIPRGRPFNEEIKVTLSAPAGKRGVIRHTVDGSQPDAMSPIAENGVITLRETGTLSVRFFADGQTEGGSVIHETYTRRAPWTGERKVVRHHESFTAGLAGWNAYEKIEHIASGGIDGGAFVRAHRGKKQNPYLSSYPTSSSGFFAGDLAGRYGGIGLEISFHQRAAGVTQPGLVSIFAKELAAWSYKQMPCVTSDWTRFRIGLRYDWTDEEAKAAGWEPDPDAFSWRETVSNAGRIVYAPLLHTQPTADHSYDMDEVTFQTIFEEPETAGGKKD
jgi:hypothetical protein